MIVVVSVIASHRPQVFGPFESTELAGAWATKLFNPPVSSERWYVIHVQDPTKLGL